MSKKEFPARGHCLSTNPIIVNYLKEKGIEPALAVIIVGSDPA